MNEPFNTKILIELTDQSPIQVINALRVLDSAEIKYTLKEDKVPIALSPYIVFDFKKKLGNKGFEVLDLLSKGYKYEAIADETGITLDGVRYYIKKIFKALGVKNGREAIRIYLTDIKPYASESNEL